MKRLAIALLLLTLSASSFCTSFLMELEVAARVSIWAFEYYMQYKTMPENTSAFLKKDFLYNDGRDGNISRLLQYYNKYGFEIDLQKKNGRLLYIYVNGPYMHHLTIYKVKKLHQFEIYTNGKFADKYYRNDNGDLIEKDKAYPDFVLWYLPLVFPLLLA